MRSRPARSGHTDTDGEPGVGRQAAAGGPGAEPSRPAARPAGPASRAPPPTMAADVLQPVGAGAQRQVRLPVAHLAGQVRLAVGHVGRVGHDQVHLPAQVLGGSASNHAPRTAARAAAAAPEAGQVGPGHVQRVGRHVGGPHLGSPARSAASASAMAPDPGPEVDDAGCGPPSRAALVEGEPGHHLGLGPGDQHPAVDAQVERPERPATEHVLQRLARRAAGRPCASRWATPPSGRGLVEAERPARRRRTRGPLHDPPGLLLGVVDAAPPAARGVGQQRPPGAVPAGRSRQPSSPTGAAPARRPPARR